MIDPNELMIGNYVKTIYNDYFYEVCEIRDSVLEIDSKVINSHVHSISYSSCLPIPITEEWLKRFGFVNVNSPFGEIYNKDIFDVHFSEDSCTVFIGHNLMLRKKYIHELQNLHFTIKDKQLI